MDIERWLNKEINKITATGVSKSAMASFIMDALAKAREQSIPAYEMTVFLGRVDGFDQDEAESKRDERAVILSKASAGQARRLCAGS